MRVPDIVLQSALFLGVREPNGSEMIAGTAFLVGLDSEIDISQSHGYLVTAAHCVRKAEQLGDLYLRINTGGSGPAETVELPGGWEFHEDEANDVAVLHFAPPLAQFEFIVVETESMATTDVIEKESIGIGDDLIVVGLFSSHYGRTRNQPIVRTGIIAAMPNDPVQDVNSGEYFEAYLAEVRSIGGLSGSPVWTVIAPGRVTPGAIEQSRQRFYLLGLMRGHWQKENEWISDFQDLEQESMNTGIAIVTPIQKALDIILSEKLRKERRRYDSEQREDRH